MIDTWITITPAQGPFFTRRLSDGGGAVLVRGGKGQQDVSVAAEPTGP